MKAKSTSKASKAIGIAAAVMSALIAVETMIFLWFLMAENRGWLVMYGKFINTMSASNNEGASFVLIFLGKSFVLLLPFIVLTKAICFIMEKLEGKVSVARKVALMIYSYCATSLCLAIAVINDVIFCLANDKTMLIYPVGMAVAYGIHIWKTIKEMRKKHQLT